MPDPPVHHRQVTAAQNGETILDATSELLEAGAPVTIAGVAAATGLSRPTVYAHFADRTTLIEAVVERTVRTARGAIDAVEPERGDPADALARVAQACWEEIHRHAAVTRAGLSELSERARRRAHDEALEPVRRLVERGRSDAVFRDDVPVSWLVSTFYALLHATADEVLAGRARRDEAGELLGQTLRELFVRRDGAAPRS